MVVPVGPLRRARLDPKFGPLYPEIPAGHWIPAWQAATRRAERLWREAGADALLSGRVLPEEHFQFRGGRPRSMGWYIEPERLSDPTRAEVSQTNW
jgi:cytochrome P450